MKKVNLWHMSYFQQRNLPGRHVFLQFLGEVAKFLRFALDTIEQFISKRNIDYDFRHLLKNAQKPLLKM